MDWQVTLKRVWKFLWEDDSILSWVANIVIAFVVIKFLLYPGLGLLLGTAYPVVSVVSESMEHRVTAGESGNMLCGTSYPQVGAVTPRDYWAACGDWYESQGITQDEFLTFPFDRGMDKGDIVLLRGTPVSLLEVGDVIVFMSYDGRPIIHRLYEKGDGILKTKGDHNPAPIQDMRQGLNETSIPHERYIGEAVARVPWIGYVKILASDALRFIVGVFT